MRRVSEGGPWEVSEVRKEETERRGAEGGWNRAGMIGKGEPCDIQAIFAASVMSPVTPVKECDGV